MGRQTNGLVSESDVRLRREILATLLGLTKKHGADNYFTVPAIGRNRASPDRVERVLEPFVNQGYLLKANLVQENHRGISEWSLYSIAPDHVSSLEHLLVK